jgi:hypothetical protein
MLHSISLNEEEFPSVNNRDMAKWLFNCPPLFFLAKFTESSTISESIMQAGDIALQVVVIWRVEEALIPISNGFKSCVFIFFFIRMSGFKNQMLTETISMKHTV